MKMMLANVEENKSLHPRDMRGDAKVLYGKRNQSEAGVIYIFNSIFLHF